MVWMRWKTTSTQEANVWWQSIQVRLSCSVTRRATEWNCSCQSTQVRCTGQGDQLQKGLQVLETKQPTHDRWQECGGMGCRMERVPFSKDETSPILGLHPEEERATPRARANPHPTSVPQTARRKLLAVTNHGYSSLCKVPEAFEWLEPEPHR